MIVVYTVFWQFGERIGPWEICFLMCVFSACLLYLQGDEIEVAIWLTVESEEGLHNIQSEVLIGQERHIPSKSQS